MKKKSLLLLLIIIFIFNLSYSQTMRVHTTTGVDSFNIADIDSITFFITGSIPTDYLKGYWPFNGNANDESGYGNHGTVYGSLLTSDRFENTNSAYSFNGSNDYIDISYPNLYPANLFTTSVTLVAWVQKFDSTGAQTIISFGHNHPDPMLFEINDGKMRVHMEGTGYVSANTTLNSNTWYHVAFVGEYGVGGTFYLNGQPDGTTGSWTPMQGTECAIGKGYTGRYFNGIIDDISVYTKVLTEQEIQTLYHEGGW